MYACMCVRVCVCLFVYLYLYIYIIYIYIYIYIYTQLARRKPRRWTDKTIRLEAGMAWRRVRAHTAHLPMGDVYLIMPPPLKTKNKTKTKTEVYLCEHLLVVMRGSGDL